jgi:lipoyl(octanoyl) transferase
MARSGWTCDLGRIEYTAAARLQRSLRAAREAGAIPDVTLILEHDPVITTGHRTDITEVAHALSSGIPVVPTERGGKATWHGPGQIVAYPILDLRGLDSDVRAYVCALERAVIETLADIEITACRRPGYPGVWISPDKAVANGIPEGLIDATEDVPTRKIASIGVRVTRWISYHGVALNVNCDLAGFSQFTPCGISDARMTSVAHELGLEAPSFQRVHELFSAHLHTSLDMACTPVSRERLEQAAQAFPVPEPPLEAVEERGAVSRAAGAV